MKRLARRLFVLALFAALVLALLWFQGILGRPEQAHVRVPDPPALGREERTAVVERRMLASFREYPGFVEAVDPAPLAPRVMARVLTVAAREGDAVEAGALLATLDDRDARARLAQAQAGLEEAEAGALQARLAFERSQRLLDAEATTAQEWEAARAAADGAKAGVERARQALEEARAALSWFRLEAPFAGRVLERRADPGLLAVPGEPLLSIYDPARLRLAVPIPEELAGPLAPGAELEVLLDGPQEAAPRRATLERALPSADPRSGTVVLHLALGAQSGLRPGQLGRARLPSGEREALFVPAAALRRVGQIERVELVQDGRVVPVTVRTGRASGDALEVLSGLAEGERVKLP